MVASSEVSGNHEPPDDGAAITASVASSPPPARPTASPSIAGLCPITSTASTVSGRRSSRPLSTTTSAAYRSPEISTLISDGNPPRTPSHVCTALTADEHSTRCGGTDKRRACRFSRAVARRPRRASGRS